MNQARIEIDGREVSFAAVWVHLQRIRVATPSQYRIQVPIQYASRVFDPYNTKNPSETWPAYLRNSIAELGTFILEGYVKTLASMSGKHDGFYQWVIATVDDIIETQSAIEILGQAIPFEPERY